MDTLILENFRCFAGRHEVPLRPLTLLVGENSTGKTSFLAACKLVHEIRRTVQTPDFNERPFVLGSFEEIGHDGPRLAPALFKLGYKTGNNALEGTFRGWNSQPVLTRWVLTALDLKIAAERSEAAWRIISNRSTKSAEAPDPFQAIWILRTYADMIHQEHERKTIRKELAAASDELGLDDVTLPYVAAPVRAEPERTYNLTSDQPKPQGNHVPVVLAQMIYGAEEWGAIEKPLVEFAKAAGLFERISIKKLRNGHAGPFQLQVKLSLPGHPRNIIDVGYGVSQVLPVVFDAIRGPQNQLYMFQQPEIHLHPRAQAELATLFGSLVKAHHKQFLVETHSDYLIDRVRIDVRDKNSITCDDVVILYFEKAKNGVKIHPIFLDDLGNLLDAPPTYRAFFMEEERRFLGVS